MLLRPRLLRASLALAALCAAGLRASAGCGPSESFFWLCLNPKTGKEDGSIYDSSHYVHGVADPCHCYDPCGPQKTCPIVVDAGPPPPGCNGSTGAGAGGGGSGGSAPDGG